HICTTPLEMALPNIRKTSLFLCNQYAHLLHNACPIPQTNRPTPLVHVC
ncbi:MAG: hypothetical protein ACJATG_001917, partial [Dinoroseobacter sp.]